MWKSSGYFTSASVICVQFLGRQSGIDFVRRLVRAAVKWRPVARQLPHRRLLDHALAGLLGGIELSLELLDVGLRIQTDVLRVDLIEHGMIFDLAIQDRLGDGGIVDFGVTVAAKADQVNQHVAAELVAIFQRHAAGAHHRIGVLAVDVKDRNRQPLGQIGGEAAGIGIAGIGGKSDAGC